MSICENPRKKPDVRIHHKVKKNTWHSTLTHKERGQVHLKKTNGTHRKNKLTDSVPDAVEAK
jgi:hypothetical protein